MSSEAALPSGEEVKSTPHRWKVIIASSFGGALEFFDFTIYNFFIIYFGQQFFPYSDDPNVGLLLAFATLGVSFFMRPLGGIMIGLYADHFGRKKALLLTIYLMTAGTLVLACAPTYATAGYVAYCYASYCPSATGIRRRRRSRSCQLNID